MLGNAARRTLWRMNRDNTSAKPMRPSVPIHRPPPVPLLSMVCHRLASARRRICSRRVGVLEAHAVVANRRITVGCAIPARAVRECRRIRHSGRRCLAHSRRLRRSRSRQSPRPASLPHNHDVRLRLLLREEVHATHHAKASRVHRQSARSQSPRRCHRAVHWTQHAIAQRSWFWEA